MSDEEPTLPIQDQAPPSNAVDVGITLAFIVMSLIFLYYSQEFAGYRVSKADPGAAIWPRAALLVIIVGGLINLVMVYQRANRDDEKIMDSMPGLSRLTKITPLRVQFGASILLMGAYFYSQKTLGFLVSTPIFLFIFAYVIGYRKVVRLGIFSFAVGVGIYLMFRVLLSIALPFGTGVFRDVGIYVTNLF